MVYVTTYRLPAKPITVRMPEPEGDDAKALEFLIKDLKLLRKWEGLLCYEKAELGDDQGLMKDLIKRYPKSSYADYARYLLASRKMENGEFAVKNEEAIQLLESINLKDFALAPDALLCLWRRTDDKEKKKKIEAKLLAEYYDSDVWLEHLADHGTTFAELMELRKPPAERKKPEPKKP